MKAKDTILKGKQRIAIAEAYKAEHPDPELIAESDFGYVQRLLKAQAEISFKAGEDKGYAHARQHCEDVIIPQAEAQGRREVVEWINRLAKSHTVQGWYSLSVHASEWQAKLKEWGIE